MQWLTAILAFATTMLIFAIVVSALVEVLHRALGSRTFGLVSMLEHYYDQVLVKFFDDDTKIDRNDFIVSMVRLRAPGVSGIAPRHSNLKEAQKPLDYLFWFLRLFPWFLGQLPRFLKFIYSRLVGTSKIAAKVGHSNWQLMDKLPVETFMERLGTLGFDKALDKKGNDDDAKDLILKDIAQKFELYGRESTLYFDRKASTFSVIIALLVAWTFYVHPYDLVHTYLKNPTAAAKVAELSDSTVKQFEQQQKTLKLASESPSLNELSGKKLDELLDEIKREIKNGQAKVKLLDEAAAPIGWPADGDKIRKWEYFCDAQGACKITLYSPKAAKDVFWLLIGGVLIGLGAPFWAKTIAQLGQARAASQNLTGILKPQTQAVDTKTRAPVNVSAADNTPITTEAFKAAANAVPTGSKVSS